MAIRAHFTATPQQRQQRQHNLQTNTNSKIVIQLFKSFPLIIIINDLLNYTTWLNDNKWLSVVNLLLLYLAILYFHWIIWLLPLLCCILFISLNYYLNSINRSIQDNDNVPTFEEIINNLDNMNTKFDTLLANKLEISRKNLLQFILILTPVHLFLMHFVISPQQYTLLLALVLTNFKSSWFQVAVKLLWRSQLVRNVFSNFLIGFNSTSYLYNNYKLLQDGKIIQFQIYQHQRKWMGIGYCNKLLPFERSEFTNEILQETTPPDKFEFPFNSNNWEWLDKHWEASDWTFTDNYWANKQLEDSISCYTRTRKWCRRAVIVAEPH